MSKLLVKYKIPLLFVLSFAAMGTAFVFYSAGADDPRAKLPAVRSFGIFPGFGNARGLERHESIEREMGRKIQNADAFLAIGSVENFNSTSWGLFEAPDAMFCKRPDITVNLGVPLNFGPGSNNLTPERLAENRRGLQATANGERDSAYRLLGERLMKCGQKNAILRIASEMDIPWNAYTMVGNEDVFKDAFRRVVNIMRATPGNNFKIDYMGNGDFNRSYTTRTGQVTTRAEAAFPGAEYVDIIGIDIYNRSSWERNKAKLDFTLAMAKKYGKPMSIPEWGLWVDETGDDPQFIQNMYDWMNATPRTGPGALYYNAYFYDYVQSRLEKAPNSRALFNRLFGIPVSDPLIPTSSNSETLPPAPEPTPVPQPEEEKEPKSSLRPDVTIVPNSITISPENPKAGDEVQFSVTITNTGQAATPNNVIHGVAFFIEGNAVAWSDSSTASLAPGESRTLISNGGPDGNESWTAQEGTVAVRAVWDDVSRITEIDESNNTQSRVFTVGPPAVQENIDTEPPSLNFIEPTNGQAVSGVVAVSINAADNDGIDKVELYINKSNKVAAIDTRSPYRFSLNTVDLRDGVNSVRAIAYDLSGNASETRVLNFTVRNNQEPESSPEVEPDNETVPPQRLRSDINGDRVVNIRDLIVVIQNYRRDNATREQGDLDGNGVVNIYDLVLLFTQWGRRQ